jgi:hypothetical protein
MPSEAAYTAGRANQSIFKRCAARQVRLGKPYGRDGKNGDDDTLIANRLSHARTPPFAGVSRGLLICALFHHHNALFG